MTFQQAVASAFSRYATFSGRASRSEFWYFVLFSILGSIVTGVLDGALFGFGPGSAEILGPLFSLAILVPSITVAVRRLHDTDRSGWWWWLWVIPLIGWIILIVWYATPGTAGDNSYGPDPLASDAGTYASSDIPIVPKR